MWCRNCQQDVPSIHGSQDGSVCCSRCRLAIPASSVQVTGIQNANPSSPPAQKQGGTVPKSSVPAPVSSSKFLAASNKLSRSSKKAAERDENEIELERELKRIDRMISVWGKPMQLRFDSAHSPTLDADPYESGTKLPHVTERNDYSKTLPPQVEEEVSNVSLLVACLTFGGLLAIFLGISHAVSNSHVTTIREMKVAASFIIVGVIGGGIGAWFEISRLKKVVLKLTSDSSNRNADLA